MLYDQSNTSFQNIALEYCIYILSNESNESKFEELPKSAGKFLNDLLRVCDGNKIFIIKDDKLWGRIGVRKTTFHKRRKSLTEWQVITGCGLVGITQTGKSAAKSEGTEYSLEFLSILKNAEFRLKHRNVDPKSLRTILDRLNKTGLKITYLTNFLLGDLQEAKDLIDYLTVELNNLEPVEHKLRDASKATSDFNTYNTNQKNKNYAILRNKLEPYYKIVKEKDQSSAKAFQDYTDANLQVLRFEKRNIFEKLLRQDAEKRLAELKKQIESDLFEFVILAVDIQQIDEGVKWLSEFTLNVSLSAKKISNQDNSI